MQRKDFLRRSFSALGIATIAPLISCSSENDVTPESTTETGSGTSTCTETSNETAGPFPTKTPASLVTADIRSDRQGTKLTVKITVQNKNTSCAGLAGALVDIWHCDAAGNYSEYGGTQMQSTNYQSVHFLRGRQTSDSNGLVTFTSIYPGWYQGRAPHIHVHVYNSSGKSLKVSQIAFPEDISKVVYAQGVYASHGQADTTNARDNIFSDGISTNLATVTGNTSDGYELTWAIVVAA
ncbi:intradiol ring-cleavage dioxygenase [Larkinella insperata]|uniref:Intradiol ring-cleavage dioxygenase n=1 Tax=Larkinella insperata TaxID=332158 RepID=A0ABW3Q4A0_9BACT|nr:intradiol ring-cleavage dioxygenase [Larkinella insperata]